MALHGQGKKRGQAGYGDGRAQIRAGDDVLFDEEAMVAELLACLEAPDYRPPTLPVVAVELMSLSTRADVAIEDVVRLLERDSLIAGRVLQQAGSASLAGAVKITSLREATMRLGLLRVRDLVMEIALNVRVFRSEAYGEAMERIRRHAVATAHVARLVCNYTPIEGEFAFVAGLLHDVGIAGTLLALAERKGKSHRRIAPPDLLVIWPAVDRVHARAGEIMAKHWQLPADVRLAITLHHQLLMDGHPHPLAATVVVANELVHRAGAVLAPGPDEKQESDDAPETGLEKVGAEDWLSAHANVDRSTEATLARARDALGIDARRHGMIEAESRALIEQLASEA